MALDKQASHKKNRLSSVNSQYKTVKKNTSELNLRNKD